jgi:hypothetical protein
MMELTNRVFGKLTVISYVGTKTRIKGAREVKEHLWKCECDCPNQTIVEIVDHRLTSGHIKSCGCLKSKPKIGSIFGRLTVIAFVESKKISENKGYQKFWQLQCSCPKKSIVIKHTAELVAGKVRSCGCLYGVKKTTHGERKTKLYNVWSCMKSRCFDINSSNYDNWGGRGITVCEEWKNSYENFRDWARNKYPNLDDLLKQKYELNRVDNDGNYCPENCNFITKKDQAINKRNTLILTYKDITAPARTLWEQFCPKDIKYQIFKGRLRAGWSVEKALETPKLDNKTKVNFKHS